MAAMRLKKKGCLKHPFVSRVTAGQREELELLLSRREPCFLLPPELLPELLPDLRLEPEDCLVPAMIFSFAG